MISNYPYTNGTGTVWCSITYDQHSYGYASNMEYPPPPRTRRERELAQLLREFDGKVKQVHHQLQVEEAFRKAISDTKARERRPHPSVRRGKERRMQTYTAAVAARMASRRP